MNKTNEQLEYIITDCYEAIAAYPMGYKVPEYHSLAKACEKELNRRSGIRINREIILTEGNDPLSVRRIGRWRKPLTEYSKKLFLNACWSLGYYKLHR